MKEGLELELPERVPCAVAFLRNEERNVFLGMHGAPRPPEGVEFGRPLPKAVVRSVPLVLLADAGTRMSTGGSLSPQPVDCQPAIQLCRSLSGAAVTLENVPGAAPACLITAQQSCLDALGFQAPEVRGRL